MYAQLYPITTCVFSSCFAFTNHYTTHMFFVIYVPFLFCFLPYLCREKNSYRLFAFQIPFLGLKSTPHMIQSDTIIYHYSSTFHRLNALSVARSVKLFSNFFALACVSNKGAKQRVLTVHIYILSSLYINIKSINIYV